MVIGAGDAESFLLWSPAKINVVYHSWQVLYDILIRCFPIEFISLLFNGAVSRALMNIYNQNWHCHSERSEESRLPEKDSSLRSE